VVSPVGLGIEAEAAEVGAGVGAAAAQAEAAGVEAEGGVEIAPPPRWEECANALGSLFRREGLAVERFSRVPYVCQVSGWYARSVDTAG
jgi:hypothetical protein